jgi:hypothetical protein
MLDWEKDWICVRMEHLQEVVEKQAAEIERLKSEIFVLRLPPEWECNVARLPTKID